MLIMIYYKVSEVGKKWSRRGRWDEVGEREIVRLWGFFMLVGVCSLDFILKLIVNYISCFLRE